MRRAMKSRHPVARSRRLQQAAWIAPYFLVWVVAIAVLRSVAITPDCTTVCLVAKGWLWYIVLYASLSLSAFVGAVEVLIWMRRLGAVNQPGPAAANH